jgi:uncharacterized protein (DUF433 family)
MKESPCVTTRRGLDWGVDMSTQILGHGIYTLPEAARLVHTSAARLKAWFNGWPRRSEAIARSDYPELVDSRRVISFHDLVDALVVAELRQQNVPLQYLKKVRDALARELKTPHPFCYKNLYTEGHHVFIEIAAEGGDRHLKELVANQYAFKKILSPFLKTIQYAESTLTALQWRPYPGVTVDPQRQFGKPIVESVNIPTSILAAAYTANDGDVAAVADWYGVTSHDITTAVEFEKTWLAA